MISQAKGRSGPIVLLLRIVTLLLGIDLAAYPIDSVGNHLRYISCCRHNCFGSILT